jgi:DNA processing protein
VTGVDDILEAVEPLLGREPPVPEAPPLEPTPAVAKDPDGAERARIMEALGPSPIEVDEVIRYTGLKPALVHLVLLELDLGGRLDRHPGQRVSLK